MLDSVDAEGEHWPDRFKPMVRIKALDSRRNFISFAPSAELDRRYRDGKNVRRGRFLDLRTLSYTFTDKKLSLDGAAAEFGLEVRKAEVEEHGVLTEQYIDYNRQDVTVTWKLHEALIAEWEQHPIDLAPEEGYSPAAISKAYLRAMGVTPPVTRSTVPVERLGQAMTAYFGGRTECRIRGVSLPVRYVDFASMYPTVFALLHLWDWVVARRLDCEDATDDARAIVERLDRAALHDPATWPQLAGVFCRVRPDGELLPTRARYGATETDDSDRGPQSVAWTIGLNHLRSDNELWFSLADVVAAKLLGGRAPAILEAFRVRPVGRLRGLRAIRLRGGDPVDPRTTDVFRLATEERARIKANRRLPKAEAGRRGQFLKTFANGGAYGIFAEVRQLDPVAGGELLAAFGLDQLSARVGTPEEPGAFSFPPLAATITGAARLMLGLLQADVEARRGAYVTCDTDSFSIVSSEAGGLIRCPGGSERLVDGSEAVLSLSWDAVGEILAGLESLNPYAPGTVPGLIKLEEENVNAAGEPVELYAMAGSSKRYVLYERCVAGIVVRKPSEHGLGLYRAPLERRTGWTEKWPEWVDVVWRRAIEVTEGRDPAPEPAWYDVPAVSQVPISSAAVLAPFRAVNAGRPYEEQVKPFGFLLLGHLDRLAAPPEGIDPDVTPMAPFTSKPSELLGLPWRNRRDGRPLAVTTRRGGEPGKARLQTVGDVVARYRLHPEHKSGDPRGGLGRRGSLGLLPRLEVHAVGYPVHIGKESNRLDDVEDGLVGAAAEVYVEYRDERLEWEAGVVPGLRDIGLARLMELTGAAERTVRSWLLEGRVPREPMRGELIALAAGRRNARPSNGEPGLT